MLRRNLCVAAWLLAALIFSTAANAQDYYFQESYTTTPIYMAGHDSADWIIGFNMTGTVSWGGATIGTLTAVCKFQDPPITMGNLFSSATYEGTYTITNYGTYEVYGEGVILMSSSTPATGSFYFMAFGKVMNGTDFYTDVYGTATYAGVGNLFSGTATVNSAWYFQFGY